MRPLPPAVLALLLLPAALAAAHGGNEAPHVNPFQVQLAPGGLQHIELTFTEGGPDGRFGPGWVFVLNAAMPDGSAPMVVALRPGHLGGLGAEVAAWRLGPGVQRVTGPMPAEDVYTLEFRHGGGPGNASLLFFYDQSCNCAAKPIPVEVPNGLVVFNADAKKGATWKATFPEPAVHHLKVTLAKRTAEASRWPEDFQVLQTSAAATVRDVGAGPARLHEVTWTADADTRYYFFVESVAADRAKFDASSPERAMGSVMVTPLFEQLAAAAKPAPGLEAAGGLAAVATAALAARRLRP